MKNILTLCILCCIGSMLWAQPAADFVSDRAFFDEKALPAFNRWLARQGLEATLHAQVVWLLDTNTHVSLVVVPRTANADTANAIWKADSAAWERNSSIPLHEALFFAAREILCVPQEKMSVQIRPEDVSVRVRLIYCDDATGAIKMKGADTKAQFRQVEMRIPECKKTETKQAYAAKTAKYTREAVYARILQYAEQRYKTRKGGDCTDRKPQFQVLENGARLRFETWELCQEVLDTEFLARFGWQTREYLSFVINYVRDSPTEFHIEITLTGKYGSGFYSTVKRGSYIIMDDPEGSGTYNGDYADELIRYADRFLLDLKTLFK